MIRVAKVVIEKDGKCLLIKRGENSKFFPKKWDFPGGKIRGGEDQKDCAVRETKEETSLKVRLGHLILDGRHIENGEKIHYKVFSTENFEGKVHLSKDHVDLKWVSRKEAMSLSKTPFVEEYFKEK